MTSGFARNEPFPHKLYSSHLSFLLCKDAPVVDGTLRYWLRELSIDKAPPCGQIKPSLILVYFFDLLFFLFLFNGTVSSMADLG